MTKIFFILLIFIVPICQLRAQANNNGIIFTINDTLRGSLNNERTAWDVLQYRITVIPDFETKSITGKSTIVYKAIRPVYIMQIDLQQPLIVDSIVNKGAKVEFSRFNNIVRAKLIDSAITIKFKPGKTDSVIVYYHGSPREAINPPWDGGFIWKKDEKGRPWMGVACQGIGASVWYACKDHQSDEPDNGAILSMIVPDSLTGVGNGKLISKEKIKNNGKTMYKWKVVNSINSYNIAPYIGSYVNFSDTLAGEKGLLNLNYWVLDYNLEKAKRQFTQAKLMLRAFEHWFGPYPFYEDDYKLVESPHLGMEHQSGIAYGNKYANGYLGTDLSGTGWGKNWDFIIVHESGHEWFGNNITTNDIADMWVHEGFANYSEALYINYYYGRQACDEYVYGIRKNIANDIPVIGPYGVNQSGSGDMYYKASNMLHSIRNSFGNDEIFRNYLRNLGKLFYHKNTTSKEIEKYTSAQLKFDYSKVFDQYLRTIKIPKLVFRLDNTNNTIDVRWDNCVAGFNLPLIIQPTNKKLFITDKQQTLKLNEKEMEWFTKKNIESIYYVIAMKENQVLR